MSKNRTSRFIPIIIAVSIVAGILIGTFYANHFSGNRLGIINTSSNKLNALLRIIDDQYVDTVKMNQLVEDAMPQILGGTRPPLFLHSCQRPGGSKLRLERKL